METPNIHVVELADLICDVQKELAESQSRRKNRLKGKDGMRFQQYFDHIGEIIDLIEAETEKDSPHTDFERILFPVSEPVKPVRGVNPYCNLMAMELYHMHSELVHGQSSADTSGLEGPDLQMLRDKLTDARSQLTKGREAKPELHFIRSKRGDLPGIGGAK
jgi:hypothetical protein